MCTGCGSSSIPVIQAKPAQGPKIAHASPTPEEILILAENRRQIQNNPLIGNKSRRR